MQANLPTQEQLAAVISFAQDNGRNWKAELRDSWMTCNYSGRTDGNLLQQVRNHFGPSWLIKFNLKKALAASQTPKLTARDFVYVYEPGIGQTYQNCAYLITLTYGPVCCAYTAHYRGQKFGWYEDFLSAVEACAKHDEARRNQEGK